MSAKNIKVVLDTQIFLRAAINRRSIPGKLIFDLAANYRLSTSAEISFEVADVLNRVEIRAKFRTLTDEVVQELLNFLEAAEQIVLTEILSISRDPKDDVFLACAKAAGADFIVTEDKDLLILNPYGDIQIINALDFLKILLPEE